MTRGNFCSVYHLRMLLASGVTLGVQADGGQTRQVILRLVNFSVRRWARIA